MRDVERKLVNEFDHLSKEDLIALIRNLMERAPRNRGRVAYLEKENEEFRRQLPGGGGNALPPFVKPNRKEKADLGKISGVSIDQEPKVS